LPSARLNILGAINDPKVHPASGANSITKDLARCSGRPGHKPRREQRKIVVHVLRKGPSAIKLLQGHKFLSQYYQWKSAADVKQNKSRRGLDALQTFIK